MFYRIRGMFCQTSTELPFFFCHMLNTNNLFRERELILLGLILLICRFLHAYEARFQLVKLNKPKHIRRLHLTFLS